MRSRTHRVLWAAGLSWGYQLLSMFVGLWLIQYLLIKVGRDTLGARDQVLVWVGFVSTIDFGLSALLPRTIGKETGEHGGWRSAATLPTSIGVWAKFAILLFPIALVVGSVGICLLWQRLDGANLWLICLVVAAIIFHPLRIGAFILSGLQDFRYEGTVTIVSYIVSVIVTVFFAYRGFAFWSLIAGWFTQTVVSQVMIWSRLALVFPSVLPTWETIRSSVIPTSMITSGCWAWLAGVGVTLTGTAEILSVGQFEISGTVFDYTSTGKLATVLAPIAITFGAAMIPGLMELRSSGNSAGMERAAIVYLQIVLAISGLFGCVIATVNRPFIEIWLGYVHYFGHLASWLIIAGMNLKHAMNAVAIALFTLNLERPLWKFNFFSGCLAVVVSLVSVKFLGPSYAGLGPIVSVACMLSLSIWFISRTNAHLSLKLVQSFFTWSFVYALAMAIGYAYCQLFEDATWTNVAMRAIGVSSIYCALLLFVARRSEALTVAVNFGPVRQLLARFQRG